MWQLFLCTYFYPYFIPKGICIETIPENLKTVAFWDWGGALAAWRARRGAKHGAKRTPEGGGGFSRNALNLMPFVVEK
jgi:hypothetical protein